MRSSKLPMRARQRGGACRWAAASGNGHRGPLPHWRENREGKTKQSANALAPTVQRRRFIADCHGGAGPGAAWRNAHGRLRRQPDFHFRSNARPREHASQQHYADACERLRISADVYAWLYCSGAPAEGASLTVCQCREISKLFRPCLPDDESVYSRRTSDSTPLLSRSASKRCQSRRHVPQPANKSSSLSNS